jgi:glutamate racemase
VTDPRPIGVFDSGVGGLTVLREILRRTPGESTIYFGDNARAPYGTRPDAEVRAFSTESIDVLVERDVKAVVVACNTSTAIALPDLRRRYDRPILGVIRPGATSAALATRNRRVGVIGTPATIRSHAYFEAIKDENPAVEVYEHATPTLVPLVEAGELSGPIAEEAVADALAPLLGQRDADGEFIFPLPASGAVDTLLLGCTHYPLLRPLIAAATGERIAIVDSATATASSLAELLSINALDAPETHDVSHVQLTTGDADRFRAIAARMFGDAFPDVETVELGVVARGADRAAAAREPCATTGSGRPGSSSARRVVPRRRSSAGGPSARLATALWTGRPPSASRWPGSGGPRGA